MVLQDSKHLRITITPLIIIISAILLSYSNTFKASWHFDDVDNILTNKPLHISDVKPATLIATFFANPIFPSKKLFYRPLSNLTFALNWYWGDKEVRGYHLVNIAIHCIAAVFLFFSVLRLYNTPACTTTDQRLTCRIALLASLFWALNPIQTQAVTYIVQRMASLAAMFYIIAIFFYLRMRQPVSSRDRVVSFISLLVCALLALGSKENAATLPISLILIEIIFFQKGISGKNLRKFLIPFIGMVLIFIACLFIYKEQVFSFINGYASRPFTLTERLLTEPRIVMTYLSQLFYPATFRLSLEHDVLLSTSLLTPWTTLPALLFIVLIISYALFYYKKHPFASFAILFYFINQLIESTIIPLELVFEHRNYLPSMFLFVPLADFLGGKINRYKETYPAASRLLVCFSIALVFILGTGTYVRNMAWISEETLWQDALQKAPGSARAACNLGNVYLKAGRFDDALSLYVRAERFSGTAPLPLYTKIWALNGMGSVFLFTDHPARSVPLFEKILTLDPAYNESRFKLALALLALHRWTEAQRQIQTLLHSDINNADYQYLYAIIKLNTDMHAAVPTQDIRDLTDLTPENTNLYLLMAGAYKQSGNYSEALKYLAKYDAIISDNILSKLTLLDINTLQNAVDARNTLAKDMTSQFTSQEIETALTHPTMMGIPLFSAENMREVLSLFSLKNK